RSLMPPPQARQEAGGRRGVDPVRRRGGTGRARHHDLLHPAARVSFPKALEAFDDCENGWTMAAQLKIDRTLTWSPWVTHLNCWLGATIPNEPGVYRIRRAGQDCLDYVGQTGMGGMTLRKRLAMQRGVYDAEMPYTDPHTAAPALWAIRRA